MCVIKKEDISAGSAESIFVLTFIKLLIVSLMKCCRSAMLNQGRTLKVPIQQCKNTRCPAKSQLCRSTEVLRA